MATTPAVPATETAAPAASHESIFGKLNPWHHQAAGAATATAAATLASAAVQAAPRVTFFQEIDTWFRKTFTNTTWAQKASVALNVVAPLVETVVALTAGEPAAAVIAKIVSEIQVDMGTASVLLQQAAATPTLTGSLTAIQANLSSLLADGHISDEKTVAEVTAIVDTISGEIAAILGVLPGAAAPVPPATAPAPAPAAAAVSVPS